MPRAPIIGLTVFACGAPGHDEWQAVVWVDRLPTVTARAASPGAARTLVGERAAAKGLVLGACATRRRI